MKGYLHFTPGETSGGGNVPGGNVLDPIMSYDVIQRSFFEH